MKTTIYLFSIVCLSFLYACSKSANDATKHSSSAKTEFKEESFTLSLKECKNITFGSDQLKLCLDSLSDSRCPMNANCIWAGVAIARFSFTKNEQVYPVILAIPTFATYPQKITVVGYVITLINVLPYPIVPPGRPMPLPTKAEVQISNN